MASRSSETVSPATSTAAALARMLPPFWPSVVEEASSHWSRATRRIMVSIQGMPWPCLTTQATFVVCIA